MRWLAKSSYDLTWFAGPFVASLALVPLLTALAPPNLADGERIVWLVAVVLIDVSHVYATLFRTYLDPSSRARLGCKLWLVPATTLAAGFLLHLNSPLWFWRVLAYVAVFHFIKQHVGFVALYQRLEDCHLARWPARAAVWAGTLGPVIWWHGHLPREFHWFTADDFFAGVPTAIGNGVLVACGGTLVCFLVWRLYTARQHALHPMVDAMVVLPALTWTVGIVVCNNDLVFTVTNVCAHGIAYLALVWISGGRRSAGRWLAVGDEPSQQPSPGLVQTLTLFLALPVGLALVEEALWDHGVWHDHAWLFGASAPLDFEAWQQALLVAILTAPQATHYVLDRWIWRPGTANPELGADLGLG